MIQRQTESSNHPKPSKSTVNQVNHSIRAEKSSHETAHSFETAELKVGKQAELTETINPAAASTNSRRNRNSKTEPAKSQFSISPESVGDMEFQESLWGANLLSRVPSWLTSLVIHLTLILVLAMLTANDGGKTIVDLLATSTESVELEPFDTLQIAIETEEIETIAEDVEISDSSLLDIDDIASMIDEALFQAAEPTENPDGLFESIANSDLEGGGVAGASATDSAQFFGIEGTGSKFIYIVDCSGSMSENVSKNFQRWDLAKRELRKSIKSLKNDQQFLILLYNNGFVSMNRDAKLVSSTPRAQNRALRWLGKNKPGDWTFCAEALAKALSLQPDSIFLLSDGEFDDRQDVFLALEQLNGKRRLASSNRKQVPVHTIALGSHIGRWTMKRIADENSGVFRLVE